MRAELHEAGRILCHYGPIYARELLAAAVVAAFAVAAVVDGAILAVLL